MPLSLGANDPLEGHRGWDKKIKTDFPAAHFHTMSGLTRLPSPLPPTTPPSPQGVRFWSQNPLCQHKSSFAFSCSTRHVTLENLQGIFHLASTSRGHHDPELPAFWGQPTSTCQSHPWQRMMAAWGERTKCGAGGGPVCQQCSTGFPLLSMYQTWPGLSLP